MKFQRSRALSKIPSSCPKRLALLINTKSFSSCPKKTKALPTLMASKAKIFEKTNRIASQTKVDPVPANPKSSSFSVSHRPKTVPLKTILREPCPDTPCKSEQTKRVYWNKRANVSNLLVIVFEGVLGDYYKDNVWGREDAKLRVRDGLINGLKTLSKTMSVVLLLTYSSTKNSEILKFFRQRQITIDAAYKRRGHDFKFRQAYDQIALDFKVAGADKWVVLSATTKEMSMEDDLYEVCTSSHKRYSMMYAPVKNSWGDVTVMMVPHFRLSKNLNFSLVVDQMQKQTANEESSFKGFWVPFELMNACPIIVPFAYSKENASCVYVMVRNLKKADKSAQTII